ncbi:MAG: hypothetical protein VX438_14340, partial [Planctomycetota bacterium]|nr:hypothetical protein [Planctomycetota bacterium]
MNSKRIGQSLLWIGFVSGALATVWRAPEKGVRYVKEISDLNAKTERTDEEGQRLKSFAFEIKDLSGVQFTRDGWHLINWTWYSFSVLLGIAGIVLIQAGKAKATEKSEKTEASLAEIR